MVPMNKLLAVAVTTGVAVVVAGCGDGASDLAARTAQDPAAGPTPSSTPVGARAEDQHAAVVPPVLRAPDASCDPTNLSRIRSNTANRASVDDLPPEARKIKLKDARSYIARITREELLQAGFRLASAGMPARLPLVVKHAKLSADELDISRPSFSRDGKPLGPSEIEWQLLIYGADPPDQHFVGESDLADGPCSFVE